MLKEDVKFITSYGTMKMAMFAPQNKKLKPLRKLAKFMIFSVLLAKNIILVKLIDVLSPALMNMEVDMINQCSKT